MTVFACPDSPNVRLVLDTIQGKPADGVPSWLLHVMEHQYIEHLAGREPGSYVKDPEGVYLEMQRRIGTCLLDQPLWDNPLSMGSGGYETGGQVESPVLDGIRIDGPDAVALHLETKVFPWLEEQIRNFDEESRFQEIICTELIHQERLGKDILKGGHGFIHFPSLLYYVYGYVPYFTAFALYPDLMERHFSLQADLAVLNNSAVARAYSEGGLPPIYRLDHDIADSRGSLVRLDILDEIWLGHFARSLKPLHGSGVRLIWHCDGNLMEMLPRLLECGIHGFQGFQYEDGMDYPKICRMKTRDNEPLIIFAGVSVTTTLPAGSPADVRDQLKYLVDYGPQTGLFLGASSSITPGVPWENLQALVEGLKYYRYNRV